MNDDAVDAIRYAVEVGGLHTGPPPSYLMQLLHVMGVQGAQMSANRSALWLHQLRMAAQRFATIQDVDPK